MFTLKIIMEKRGIFKRKIKYNPFLEISDTRDYWLGYLAADGNIGSKYARISLNSKDVDHIDKYNNWLGNKLIPQDNKRGIRIYHFANYEVKDYLISLGITPKKSLTLEVKFPITWPFLRGVFDGDGSARSSKERTEIKITSGSLKFLEQIKEFLDNENIDCSIRVQQRAKNITWQISILSTNRCKFIHMLYKDAQVFLERKRFILDHIVEKRCSKSGELLGTPIRDNQQPSSENDIKVSEKVQRIGIEESTQ